MLNHLHDKSKRFVYPLGQAVGEIAYLWADRFQHAISSKDTILIDCEELFSNREYVLERICSFLDIEYIPVGIDFHVKSSGLNHTNSPINIDECPKIKKRAEPYQPFDSDLLLWCNEAYGSKTIISSFIY